MSLTKCNECRAKISDTAKRCPKCGAKTDKSSSNKERLIEVGVIAIIIIFLISMVTFVCYFIVTNRSSYKYGEEALDILNSYENGFITENEVDYLVDDLTERINNEMEELKNSDSNEYTRLLSINIQLNGIVVDLLMGGMTIDDIDDRISEIKSNMRFFS